MCLLFLFLNDDPEKSDYKLIVASNRDEYWVRPTETAKLRGENPQWLGGIDLEPGREGGTWLGLSTSGKFGALLNILTRQEPDKRGRGSLVKDFVCEDLSSKDYLEKLAEEKSAFNPFQLIMLDLRESSAQVHYLENRNPSSRHEAFPPGIYSFDNTDDCESLWQKTTDGEEKFTNIVKEHGWTSQRTLLTDKLSDLLSDKTQHFPDKQLQKQFAAVWRQTEGEVIQQRSARFVFSPLVQYGTRTNTLILIDFNGNCEYVERTLATPVNIDNPAWTTEKYTLQLDLASESNIAGHS